MDATCNSLICRRACTQSIIIKMSTALLHTLVALIITFRYKFYEGPVTSGYPYLPIADAIFSHFWFFMHSK